MRARHGRRHGGHLRGRPHLFEAWQDAPGGLNGPLVLVGAYLLVRCVHLTLDAVAAAGDRELRRLVTITWGPLLASVALLIPGALLGAGPGAALLFAAALLVDWVGVYLTSRRGSWRLHGPHWTERHGLFIILAIGESVVAIGVGAAERRLAEARGQAKVRLAVEAYTYGHFPIVAGIVLAALGMEGVLATRMSPSRWAPSMRRRCSAGRRCTCQAPAVQAPHARMVWIQLPSGASAGWAGPMWMVVDASGFAPRRGSLASQKATRYWLPSPVRRMAMAGVMPV